jgi:hypothetical protein
MKLNSDGGLVCDDVMGGDEENCEGEQFAIDLAIDGKVKVHCLDCGKEFDIAVVTQTFADQ